MTDAVDLADRRSALRPGGARHEPDPARRRPQGAGRVRLLLRPLGRRHAVGRDAALAAPVRPHRRASTSARRGRSPASRRSSPPTTCPGSRRTASITAGPAGVRLRRRALRRRAGRRGRRRPPRDGRRALRGHRRRLRGARAADRPRGGDRRRPTDPPRRQRVPPPAHRARRPDAAGAVVVEGTYEVGMQDQAFLGPEAALAVPDRRRRRRAYIATQWLHEDRNQVAACLGLPEEKVRLMLGGVGGAFGAREDVSLQVHLLPARAAHRPAGEDGVRPGRVVLRPRAPAPGRIWMRHHADRRRHASSRSRRGSCSTAAPTRRRRPRCSSTRFTHAPGPYRVPERRRRRLGGAHQQPAVRGDARLRRACRRASPTRPDGQAGRGAAASTRSSSGCATPWRPATCCSPARCSERRAGRRAASGRPRRCRCPPTRRRRRRRPAAAARRRGAHRRRRRTCGAASASRVAIKNLMYSEGFDDYSTARCRLERRRGHGEVRRPPRSARASSPSPQQIARDRARRRRGRCSSRPTRRSARPARRRRRGRRGCRAARWTRRAGAVRERLFEQVGRGARGRPDPARGRGHRRRRHDRATLRVPVADATAGERVRGDRRVPPPAHRGARRERPGRRATSRSPSWPTGRWSTSTPSSGW